MVIASISLGTTNTSSMGGVIPSYDKGLTWDAVISIDKEAKLVLEHKPYMARTPGVSS